MADDKPVAARWNDTARWLGVIEFFKGSKDEEKDVICEDLTDLQRIIDEEPDKNNIEGIVLRRNCLTGKMVPL